MADKWAERERRTNHLARAIADYIFNKQGKQPTWLQIHGLAGLAWITKSKKTKDGISPKHIKSVVIPKLNDALNEEFSSKSSIKEVIHQISQKIGDETVLHMNLDKGIGFTNFYNAYRKKPTMCWVKKNHSKLLSMCKDAMRIKNINDRYALVEKIEELPKIMRSDGKASMRRENYLTPLFFMLDPEIKFPIINGRTSVKNLLKQGGVSNKCFVEQAKYMIKLCDEKNIDAAALDRLE